MGCENLPTLADKLNHIFQNNLKTLALKNKSKSVEEVKAFKLADKIFDDYSDQLQQVFKYFSAKSKPPANVLNGRWDITIQVHELLDMLKKANLLDGKTTDLQLSEVIFMIEKYYDPSHTLKSKLSQECFDSYLAANPMLLLANQKAAAKKEKEEQARREAEQRKAEGGEDAE